MQVYEFLFTLDDVNVLMVSQVSKTNFYFVTFVFYKFFLQSLSSHSNNIPIFSAFQR